MKKKNTNRLRYIGLCGILFILGMFALAVYGSIAAYTNFNSVKRVVSTGTQSDTMFGSNYLSLLSAVDTDYSIKRISLTGEAELSFTVAVCNYVWGDEQSYNPKDITYTLTAQVIAVDGGKLPDDVNSIKINGTAFDTDGRCVLEDQKLSSACASRNEYRFILPQALKNKVKIRVVAEASAESADAVNSEKLAAILSFADYVATKTWTGHFLDSTEKAPEAYDAYNYELTGNGAGTVTITWPDSLQLSKWETNGIQVKETYSFDVDDTMTSIQFRFYRNPASPLTFESTDSKTEWKELEKLITVTFKEKG